MPAKIARSAHRPSFGLPKVPVAFRTLLLPCKQAGKTPIFKRVRESSGESQITCRIEDSAKFGLSPSVTDGSRLPAQTPDCRLSFGTPLRLSSAGRI